MIQPENTPVNNPSNQLKKVQRSSAADSSAATVGEPFIDFHTQRLYLERWVASYNDSVRPVRQALLKQGKKVPDKYQLIKSSHVQFMLQLVRETIDQLASNLKLFRHIGGIQLNPEEPYVLWANNVALANRLCTTDRTVRNHIDRLKALGFLVDKKFHGTRSDFELHINPEMLLIFDLEEAEKPLVRKLKGETVEWALPSRLRKKLPLLQKNRTDRTSSKRVKSKRTDELSSIPPAEFNSESSSASLSKQDSKKNTPNKANPIEDRLEKICPHPALYSPLPRREHQTRGRAEHPLEQQIREKTLHFLRFAHLKLWDTRMIYDDQYHRAFEHIVERYFVNCRTLKGVNQRIAQMEKVVEFQADWVSKLEGRYTMFPAQFFNLDRKIRDEDYSGFKGVWKKIYEQRQKGALSNQRKKDLGRRRAFMSHVNTWLKNPTDSKYIQLNRRITDKFPEFLAEFYMIIAEHKKAKIGVS